MKKRLERANKADSDARLKKGKHESFGFGSSAPRFEDIILTSSPGSRSMSQLNLSAMRKSATSGDEADHGNVCPRFHAYQRRAASAHAGKLTPSLYFLYNLLPTALSSTQLCTVTLCNSTYAVRYL